MIVVLESTFFIVYRFKNEKDKFTNYIQSSEAFWRGVSLLPSMYAAQQTSGLPLPAVFWRRDATAASWKGRWME